VHLQNVNRQDSSRRCHRRSAQNSDRNEAQAGTASTRRDVLNAAAAAPLVAAAAPQLMTAAAPPASTALELQDVTPDITPAAPLRSAERAVIDVFERNTRSVANIFDLSLQGRTAQAQAVDVPEGNGSGFVWDREGHIVTNYHVLSSAMKGVGPDAAKRGDAKVRLVAVGMCCETRRKQALVRL
jgi:S1-C subfamily serine protease